MYFFDIGHPCFDQLTPVKTEYPLTSITWPYRGLKFRTHQGHMFFEVDRWPRAGFLIGSRAHVRLTCWKQSRIALNKDCRLQGWYYMKNVSRHQHDKNRYSRIATVDSFFVLFGTRQHCVAKICNASQTASTHKLQNDPFTISSSVLWTHFVPLI